MSDEKLREALAGLKVVAAEKGLDLSREIEAIGRRLEGPALAPAHPAYDKVQLARKVGRPTTLDYINRIFDGFVELHGDRHAGDDPAMVGGIATIGGTAFTVFGQERGRNMKETIYRKNGMAEPEGYRKALRLAKQAERFGRPIVSFIDIQGAYPGVSSEERGIGEAIARNLKELSVVGVPFLCFVIGEGGSGGALAIAVGDEVWMLENATYSVISPEGCASILIRDSGKARESAEMLKLTAPDHLKAGIIDGIIPEPAGGAHNDPAAVAAAIKERIIASVAELSRLGREELLGRRFEKFARIGVVEGLAPGSEGFLRRFLFEA